MWFALDGDGQSVQAAEAIAASDRDRESFQLADTIADPATISDPVTITAAFAFVDRFDVSEPEPHATAQRHRLARRLGHERRC